MMIKPPNTKQITRNINSHHNSDDDAAGDHRQAADALLPLQIPSTVPHSISTLLADLHMSPRRQFSWKLPELLKE